MLTRRCIALLLGALLSVDCAQSQILLSGVHCTRADLSARPLPEGVQYYQPALSLRIADALSKADAHPSMPEVEGLYTLSINERFTLLLWVRGPMVCYWHPIAGAVFEAVLRGVRGLEM